MMNEKQIFCLRYDLSSILVVRLLLNLPPSLFWLESELK
jgi:hypothetical protein